MESLNVSSIKNTQSIHFGTKVKKAVKEALVPIETKVTTKENHDNDSYTRETSPNELSVKDKQQILKKARTTAAGWSVFGGIFSIGYFALRKNKTIAKKYDLDIEKDKDFISTIRAQQVLYAFPSIIPGYGSIPAIASWLYNKLFVNTDKINVDKTLSL